MISKHVLHVIWSSIAIEIAKLHIVPYTKRHARNVLPNYMMRFCSKSLHLVKIVQFAFFPCHYMKARKLSTHAVVKPSAVVVFMRWKKKHLGEVEK